MWHESPESPHQLDPSPHPPSRQAAPPTTTRTEKVEKVKAPFFFRAAIITVSLACVLYFVYVFLQHTIYEKARVQLLRSRRSAPSEGSGIVAGPGAVATTDVDDRVKVAASFRTSIGTSIAASLGAPIGSSSILDNFDSAVKELEQVVRGKAS